jgi:hypothetical protein
MQRSPTTQVISDSDRQILCWSEKGLWAVPDLILILEHFIDRFRCTVEASYLNRPCFQPLAVHRVPYAPLDNALRQTAAFSASGLRDV